MRFPAALRLTLLLVLQVPALGAEGPKDDKDLKPIELADILAWKSIRNATLSNDGGWLAYRLSPTEGDSQVVVRSTREETEYRFDIGEVPSGGGRRRGAPVSRSTTLAFSSDGRWFAFTIYPTRAEQRRLRGQREAARERAEEGQPAAPRRRRTQNAVGLVELSSGEQQTVKKVRSFSFSGENPAWLALHRYAAENQGRGDDAWTGADLIVERLGAGTRFSVGNVSSYAFDKQGRYLAWTVDAQDQAANGVALRDLETGVERSLAAAEASFERLTWTEEGDGLAVLVGIRDDAFKERLFSLAAWRTADLDQRVEYDPRGDDGFPAGMTLSSHRSPRWNEELTALFFGIEETVPKEEDARKAPAEGDEDGTDEEQGADRPERKQRRGDAPEPAGLVIWHWKDPRLQSMQQVQEARDRNFSYLAGYWPAEGRFVRLADEGVRNVSIGPEDRYAVGLDNSPYELAGNLDGRRYQDVYVGDLATGERKLAIARVRWYNGASPDGTKLLYYRDGHYHVYDIAGGTDRNITQDVKTSFINTEDDHNIVDPPIRPLGWTAGGRSVVLFDNWDLWDVPADGGAATRLTPDGREEGIRYRRRFVLDPDEEGIDLSTPVYLGAYQERTKKAGIVRLVAGGVERLLWDDAQFALTKAEKSDVYLYTRQDGDEYPDYYVTGPGLADGRRLTEANPQQKDFRWSAGARLIEYTGDKGQKLQAALFLPAGYEEGKSYPTIVYIYEKLSQRLNGYDSPSANGFSKSAYTSNGYAVLMPDIVYEVNDPGRSAVWCVLPALEAAIATGIVDADRVGLHGHSWGGYQTSFLVTQTDAFAAAVAGAPLTNMISMYSSVYWNTGGVNGAIFESSQGRFTGGPWEVPEAYARNSPVYFADNVGTPLIILHNDKDGAVDFNQGIEYFNTLRRLGKPVVMLQYEGENHGLRIPANRKDYTVRMREFFDHYLKGQPMPDWLAKGVSHLDQEKHLKERAVP